VPDIRAFSAVPNSGSVSFADVPFCVATVILRTRLCLIADVVVRWRKCTAS
jgi:hypothetical protein